MGALGRIGAAVLLAILATCLASLPWTLGDAPALGQASGVPRYSAGDTGAARLPPWWIHPTAEQATRLDAQTLPAVKEAVRAQFGGLPDELTGLAATDARATLRQTWPRYWLGTDVLGRSVLVRCLAGGGISLGVGIAAALISVLIGTLYGGLAGYLGGRVDALMMRIVDVLYGLPYVLLVVLLAVAGNAMIDEYTGRGHERTAWLAATATPLARSAGDPVNTPTEALRWLDQHPDLRHDLTARALAAVPPRQPVIPRTALDITILLAAIGGVSWLTMARVVRGQVLSLKHRPFVEAARALGTGPLAIFYRHLLPNLWGPIIVYATLTVPQAILQESFLSFLGIGVQPPLPSWGNLAAEGLTELNPFASNWWLLLFPCLLLAVTLLALNFVGEGLREALDPQRPAN